MHFRWFALKGVPPWRILDDASNLRQKQATTSSKIAREIVCNGIWQKKLLILKFEKGFLAIKQYFLDYKAWQNMDQVSVKWKFEAVKIQNWTKLTKNSQSKSIVLTALDNNLTLPFIFFQFSHYHEIFRNYVHPLMDPLFAPLKTKALEDSDGSLDWYII